MKCKCDECGITKYTFVAFKKGGALARRRGPSTVDKIAYVASNFVTPAPSFTAAAKVLAGQAYKRIKDNADYYRGRGVDIHKAIGKVPKPKNGWTAPGYKYAGPYNPLHKQLKHDEKCSILEIYDKPTGKTDAVAMQHDVDYTICGDDKKCKHRADAKMVKSLDAISWKERPWGHCAIRNTMAAKKKLGLGVTRKKKRLKTTKRYKR